MVLNSTKSHPSAFSIPYRFIFPHFLQGKELFALASIGKGESGDHNSESRTQSTGSLLQEAPVSDREPPVESGCLLEHHCRLELGCHGIHHSSQKQNKTGKQVLFLPCFRPRERDLQGRLAPDSDSLRRKLGWNRQPRPLPGRVLPG